MQSHSATSSRSLPSSATSRRSSTAGGVSTGMDGLETLSEIDEFTGEGLVSEVDAGYIVYSLLMVARIFLDEVLLINTGIL